MGYTEHKVHAHTETSVKRRDPSIQQLARSYNELCTKIAKHIQGGHAPRGAICPDKIESSGLFTLDVDDAIWQDVGLNDDGSEEPPRWLCDADVRNGILAMLDLDRCKEEELRLRHERCAMQEWFSEEWAIVSAAYKNTGVLVIQYHSTHTNRFSEDAGLRYQLGILKDRLCHLCALWQKSVHTLDIAIIDDELPEWGPNPDELLDAKVAEVTAAWGDYPIEDDDNDDGNDRNLDGGEDEMDIGLITALEAMDLADAYRGTGLDEVDFEPIDDILS